MFVQIPGIISQHHITYINGSPKKKITTRGAWPRRAAACLGSAHARNYRGRRQIETVNATHVRTTPNTTTSTYTPTNEKEP